MLGHDRANNSFNLRKLHYFPCLNTGKPPWKNSPATHMLKTEMQTP